MSALCPKPPVLAIARRETGVYEYVIPKFSRSERDFLRLCKALPGAMPDWIEVNTVFSKEGTERSTSARYDGKDYLIHYAFESRIPAVTDKK